MTLFGRKGGREHLAQGAQARRRRRAGARLHPHWLRHLDLQTWKQRQPLRAGLPAPPCRAPMLAWAQAREREHFSLPLCAHSWPPGALQIHIDGFLFSCGSESIFT